MTFWQLIQANKGYMAEAGVEESGGGGGDDHAGNPDSDVTTGDQKNDSGDGKNILNNSATDDNPVTTTFPEDWRDRMAGDDAKFRKQLERYQSPESFAKAHRELQAKLSSGEFKSAKLPENPTDEELAAFRKEHNVPEKIEDYLADMPGGVVLGDADRERVNSFLEAMHGQNVSKEHVQAAVAWNQAMVEQEMQSRHERNVSAQQETEDSLRQEWGRDYRRNINLVVGMLDGLPKEAREFVMNAQTSEGVSLFNNPDVARWFVDLARASNPVATVVPGASNPQAITDEITTLEKRMKDDYQGWFKDEASQTRLRELYEAQERLG